MTTRAKSGIAISQAVKKFLIDSGEIKGNYSLHVVHYGLDSTFAENPGDVSVRQKSLALS